MEILLLLLLGLGGVLLFVPEFLRERALASPAETVSDFKRGMTALAISTHNYAPGYYYSYSAGPEPYVRRSRYTEQLDEGESDFIPYPSNRRRAEMESRRRRVVTLLLVVTMCTAIVSLIPSVRWMIPLHVIVLVILSGYIALAFLTPNTGHRR